VPRLFKLLTALLEYLDLLQGGCSPGLLHLYDCDYEIYNIAHSLIIAGEPIQTIAPCAPLTFLLFEKKTLRYQLSSTHYAAVRINNCLKRTFVIKVATMKIMDDLMEAIMCLPLN